MPYDYTTNEKHWAEKIHSVAVGFMNSVIEVFVTTTNQYGVPVSQTLWVGKARVQQLRTPSDSSTGYGSRALRSFRFQIDPDDNPPNITEGAQVRVLDGGRDPDLCFYAYTVHSAVNSSHRAVRTLECRSEMKVAYTPEDWVAGLVVDDTSENPISGVVVELVYEVVDPISGNTTIVVDSTSDSIHDGRYWAIPTDTTRTYSLRFTHPDYVTLVIPMVEAGDTVFAEMEKVVVP